MLFNMITKIYEAIRLIKIFYMIEKANLIVT